uniref:Oxysterol-binding protein n=1 Tax=Echeneis naucrates TaxID=173247 RepID=A0A665WIY3_ECHNA
CKKMTSPSPTHSDSSVSSKHDSHQDSWEIVEGLRGVPASMQEPDRQEGLLLKKRKWPMKGWHKRYFLLEKGILKYAKHGTDLKKGKLHGLIDVGLSVMSIKKKAMCIDLDTEDNIYHLKVNLETVWACVWAEIYITMTNPSLPFLCLSLLFLSFSPVHTALKSAFSSLVAERDKLRYTIDKQTPQPVQVTGLKSTYASVSETIFARLHHNYVITRFQFLVTGFISFRQDCSGSPQSLVHQVSNESRASIPESISEFFDAQEYLLSSSSSENEVRHHLTIYTSSSSSFLIFKSKFCDNLMDCVITLSRRRSTLPSPSPTSSVSLWNILRNNIGKDLSKVAMPVQLNEPLNTLQRLCEELEYSKLLDTANKTQDPYQRMAYIATFAISAYASTFHRAASKPFNPVLGETYECDRPDKGFRFIAEQVSHHPPVSACHSDSKNFTFWQDVRWKNKFWGKSMEIVPMGTTHVTLPAFGDHYEWNKVTSCIHNILSGQRWIEHYGEMTIKNINSNVCQCKVTFVKAKSWNSTVNEIEGVVTDSNGKVVHSIFGKWHESLFQGDPPSATCIWRANTMPVDQEQYYGFTQFAVELNELDSTLRPHLPPTDTRFRPDQRLLEEGNPEAAEEQKQRIEQLQRERRKVLQDNNMAHQPRFFKKSKDDTWVSNDTYWELRKDLGFSKFDFPVLW